MGLFNKKSARRKGLEAEVQAKFDGIEERKQERDESFYSSQREIRESAKDFIREHPDMDCSQNTIARLLHNEVLQEN